MTEFVRAAPRRAFLGELRPGPLLDPMSVSELPQAGLRRRSQEFRRPQSAQGCKGEGEARSCAGNCGSSAEAICPFSRQAEVDVARDAENTIASFAKSLKLIAPPYRDDG
jgi:hypothetical protein